MTAVRLHRFEEDGKRYVIDPETCFCFECDAISWDVLEHYPGASTTRINHLLGEKHPPKELEEVISELEWLRATKSILPVLKQEDVQKRYEVARGLKKVTVLLEPEGSMDLAESALDLLLGRSGTETDLEFVLVAPRQPKDVPPLAAFCTKGLAKAAVTGKKLTMAVRFGGIPPEKLATPLQGHHLSIQAEFKDKADTKGALKALLAARPHQLAKQAKALSGGDSGVTGRAVLRPGGPSFCGGIQELERAGFRTIELDLDGAYVSQPGLEPSAMTAELCETARYYAKRLLAQKQLRLDPIAPLFARIYEGAPRPRTDPAGTQELAVDARGGLYPSALFTAWPAFRVGSLPDGAVDEEALRRFDDVGSLTTPSCMRCWARNLCGGGSAAVHEALGASFRHPQETWCDAQRAWVATAVAAFNLLSSEGVNFTRIYKSLDLTAKPSIFQAVRAAFRMSIGIRPIEEADAEWLTQWENWSEAAYFLCTESGLFMATRYDREMDALHPRAIEQELVLLRKNGDPFGLVRLSPNHLPGTANVGLYFRDEEDYANEGARRSFRHMLQEMAAQQGVQSLIAQAGPKEDALAEFLQAIGFDACGVQREALYLHGEYHDVRVFTAQLGDK